MLLEYFDKQEECADKLQTVLFAYRTSKHVSTGFLPFYLLYNQHHKLTLKLMVDDEPKETNVKTKLKPLKRWAILQWAIPTTQTPVTLPHN